MPAARLLRFREIDTPAGGAPRPRPVDRLPDFIGLQVDARAVLAARRVLLIGVGSVGARVALHLARCRIGELALVDPDRFTPGFDTQAIRGVADVGRDKATTVGSWAKAVSPGTTVRACVGAVESLPWLSMDAYDVVVASTDNLRAESCVGQRCLWLGKPLVYAGVYGPGLVAQVQTFGNRSADAPCPACAFGPHERAQRDREIRFSCDPSAPGDGLIQSPPTLSVAPLCSLAADMAALAVLRRALGLGRPPADDVRQYSGYLDTVSSAALRRNPECLNDHTVLRRATLQGALARHTLRRCASAAGIHRDADLAEASFRVDDGRFAWIVVCAGCGGQQPFNRFVEGRPDSRHRCAACGGGDLHPHPFFSYAGDIPARQGGLLPHLDTPLDRLGAAALGVVVRKGGDGVLVKGAP